MRRRRAPRSESAASVSSSFVAVQTAEMSTPDDDPETQRLNERLNEVVEQAARSDPTRAHELIDEWVVEFRADVERRGNDSLMAEVLWRVMINGMIDERRNELRSG